MNITGQSLASIADEVESIPVNHIVPVARICQRIGITESINESLSRNSELDPGTMVTMMVMDTLSGRSPLYKVEEFVREQDTELLLGSEIEASRFNDDTLGRTLDSIHEYGTSKLFTEITMNAARIFQLNTNTLSYDTTSVSVWGNYASSKAGQDAPHITHGYSKDKRPDLKQFMVSMLCVEGNIPISGGMEDGNSSDNRLNNEELQRIGTLLKPLGKNLNEVLYVADCKLVTKDNLKVLANAPFITRLPASYNEHEAAVEQAINAERWQSLGVLAETPSPSQKCQRTIYKAHETRVTLYGKSYRAIVIETDHLDKRRTKGIEARRTRELQKIRKSITKATKNTYRCLHDAESALEAFCKEHCTPYWMLTGKIEKRTIHAPGPAPKNGPRKISRTDYRLAIEAAVNETYYRHKLRHAGCFVLLTSVDGRKKNAKTILKTYKQQYGVEQNFSFLKEPLIANDTFLNKPERIDALVLILLLSLMVWNLIQRELRRSPEAKQGLLNNLNKRPTTRPTGYLFMCHLSAIIILKRGHERRLPRNAIRPQARNYLKALGLDESIFITPPPLSKGQRC